LALFGFAMHAHFVNQAAQKGLPTLPRNAKECLSMTNTTPQLLTIRDAASALRVSYATARKWVIDGRLPSIAFGQRTRRIPAMQLAKFISANTTGGN
jgi:excisionase family DNA binding protein